MKKPIHCDKCGPGQGECPCDCHPYGVKWRQERAQRLRDLEALGIPIKKTTPPGLPI